MSKDQLAVIILQLTEARNLANQIGARAVALLIQSAINEATDTRKGKDTIS